MPEPLHDKPPVGTPFFQETSKPYSTRALETLKGGDFTAEQIKQAVAQGEMTLLSKEIYPPDEVRTIFDVLYGPVRAVGETRERTNEIQHNIAAQVVFGTHANASSLHAESMYRVVTTNEVVAQSPYAKRQRPASCWARTKALYSAQQAFQSEGAELWLPNLPNKLNWGSEFKAWTIIGNTDFIARHEGKVFLVQVYGDQEGNEVNVKPQEYRIVETPTAIQAHLRSLGLDQQGKISHRTISIPDAGWVWQIPHEPIGSPLDYKQALITHTNLRPAVQQDILNKIHNPQI